MATGRIRITTRWSLTPPASYWTATMVGSGSSMMRMSMLPFGRTSTAIFARAIALKPNYPEAYYGLAQAQMDLGQFELARKNLDSALVLKPRSSSSVWQRTPPGRKRR